jgi:hypothetical protein
VTDSRIGDTVTTGNGSASPTSALDPVMRSSRPPGPTARPAAVVLAVIVVVFLAGFVADLLSSGGHRSSTSRSPSSPARPVAGSGLTAEPAAQVLSPIVTPGDPPSDILGALVVPAGTKDVPRSAAQRGLGLYDASVAVEAPAAETAVLQFLRVELAAGRWSVTSAGPAPGGTYRIIAQHPGSDGYEWELGATVSPTTFTSSVPGMSVPASGVTPFTLRLFAISDAA